MVVAFAVAVAVAPGSKAASKSLRRLTKQLFLDRLPTRLPSTSVPSSLPPLLALLMPIHTRPTGTTTPPARHCAHRQTEKNFEAADLESAAFFRPGTLIGNENTPPAAATFMKMISFMLPVKYRDIHINDLGAAVSGSCTFIFYVSALFVMSCSQCGLSLRVLS